MITREGAHRIEVRDKARGGNGQMKIHHLFEPEQMFMKGRMFVKAVLKPGESLGYHIHENEVELFYILKGSAKVNDNGKEYILYPGDTMYTGDGQGHSIEACENNPLEYLAVVIKK